MKNKPPLRQRAADAARTAKFHVVTGGTALAVVPTLASAQEFDSDSITNTIAANGLIAVGIVGALILAGWGVRSMGLLRGRG